MFSKATIMDIMFLLRDYNSHSDLDNFAFRFNLDEVAVGNNKDQRVLNIGRYLFENPNEEGPLGGNLAFEIAEKIINETINITRHFDPIENEFNNYPQLRRLLLKDGLVIEDGKLLRTFDSVLDFEESYTLLEKMLDKHGFSTAKGHYNQASSAFNRGEWASCNGQLRTYVEELLNKIAEKIFGKTFSSSQEAKSHLSKSNPPIFYKDLNEWLDNGQGFFETFWKRLHQEGSHPGLSNEEDSIFRLNLVQVTGGVTQIFVANPEPF